MNSNIFDILRLSHWANLKASGIFEQLAPILVDQLFER